VIATAGCVAGNDLSGKVSAIGVNIIGREAGVDSRMTPRSGLDSAP
jgi:hypothetical protein